MRKISLLLCLMALGLCVNAKKTKKVTPVFTYMQYEGSGNCDSLTLEGGAIIPGWASDPSICRVGDDYWLVTSTFGYYPGVPLYHSKDLLHWELVKNILDRPSQFNSTFLNVDGRSLDRGGIYAPTIRYNEQNKTYYMITTDVSKVNTAGKGGHFYVTAKDPRGEWSDPVWLEDIDGIDPSFFFDEDGKSYIVYKEDVSGQPKWNIHRALRIVRFDVNTGKTIGEPMPFLEEGVGPEEHLRRDEGPHICKVNDKYILIAAEGGTGIYHSEVCYKSDNVFGPYTRWSRNPMLTQRYLKAERPYAVTCSGHADLVQTKDGKWFAVFLATRTRNGLDLGRETFLMPAHWSKDGYPYITQEKDTVPDHSTSVSLRLDRDSDPHWLTAPCVPGFRGIRLQHHQFSLSTEIDLDAMHKTGKTKAGLMLLKNESHQYRFVTEGSQLEIIKTGKNGTATVLQTIPLIDPTLSKLIITVFSDGKQLTVTLSASTETSTSCLTAAPTPLDINYLSQATAGGFTGITLGEIAE